MKTVAAKGYTKYFDDRLALLVCNVAEEQEQFDTRMRNMRLKHMKVFNDGAQKILDNQVMSPNLCLLRTSDAEACRSIRQCLTLHLSRTFWKIDHLLRGTSFIM
jgi:hypothetical protein